MQISKEIAGFSGAKADDLRKAIGKKNRAAMAALKPEFVEGCRASGTSPTVTESAVADQRKVGRLLVQQEPRRLLRADRLPHRLAEGQLHGRVHGGADLLGDVHEGQGPVLRGALRGDGDRDPAAGREPPRPRVHGRAGQHPLRPGRRQGRRLPGGRGDQAGAAGRPASPEVQLAVGFLRARGQPHGQQEGDRGVDQVRRLRLHRRDPQGHAGGARAGPGRGSEDPAGRADRPGLDLRPGYPQRTEHRRAAGRRRAPGAAGGTVSVRPGAPDPPADPDRGVRAGRAAGGGEGSDRPVRLRASAEAAARGAASAASTARSRRSRIAATRTW